jgi:hypothetical protein
VADFIDQGISTTFLDEGATYSPVYDRPENYDAVAVANQDEGPDDTKSRIARDANQTYQTDVTTAIDNKDDPVAVADKITNGERKLFGVYSSDEVYIEDSVIATSPGYKAADLLYYRNLQIMSEEIEKASVEQQDRTWLGYGVDFVDREIIRATLFGWWENATNRTAREGADIANTLFNQSDPREVRRFMKEKVDAARSEGILVGENFFSYNQMLREAYSLGYNPDLAWDRTFAALDFAGFVTGASKLSKLASLKSATAATRAGALGGVEEANKIGKNLHVREIDPINTANMQSAAVDLNPGVVRPSTGFVQRIVSENRIAQKIMAYIKGAVPDPESILNFEAVKAKAATAFAKATKTTVYKTDIVKTSENITAIEFSIGKKDGVAFKLNKNGTIESGAQKIADRVGGEVVPLDPQNLSLGYVVKVQEAADTLQDAGGAFNITLAKTMWNKTLGALLDNPFVGSTASRGIRELNELALRSENANKYLRNAGAKAEKNISKLSADERSVMDSVLKDLVDGPDSTLRKRWDESEFSSRWKAVTGTNPNKKVLAAYHSAEDLSDMAYFFNSMEALKSAVAKGFKNSVEVEAGVFVPARRVRLATLKEGTKIFDGAGRGKLLKEDYKEFGNDFNVWELSSPWNDQEFVAFPTSNRVIGPRDVLGYSAYGRRSNPDIRYFTFLKFTNGDVKSILGSLTAKQAELAKAEFKAIQTAYKTGGTTAPVTKGYLKPMPSTLSSWDETIPYQVIGDTEPVLPSNHFRIYRGEGGSKQQSVSNGGWWTTNLTKAKGFSSGGGEVKYIDIDLADRKTLMSFVTGHGGADELFITSKSVTQKSKKLVLTKQTTVVKDIDEVIQNNNSWNPKINTKAEMDEFLKEHKINIFEGEIESRLRDGPYQNPNDKFYNGDAIGDVIERRNARAELPIAQYGGGGTYNPDPIDSIIQQYGSEAHRYAFSLYNYRAMQGWLDTADNMMANNLNVVVRVPDAQSLRQRFLNATVEGTSPEAQRMREVKEVIMRQASIKSEGELARESFAESMSEALFDQTGIKANFKEPSGKLLKLGFFSAFAFNASQMFLQASQVANVIAVAGRAGIKGTAHSVHIRKILMGSDDIATEALGLDRLAKSMEMPLGTVQEITRLFRETLPNVVMGDILELGTSASVGLSTNGALGKAGYKAKKFGKAVYDIGMVPFNAGEATAKSSAFMTAAIEFIEKNPNISVLSESGRNYIARRTSTLTQNMTTATKSKLQTGLWRVPSQWLNYFFRTSEQVFVGRDLNLAERSRLGLMVMPFYGFTGLGLAPLGASDVVSEWLGLDPTDEKDQATYIGLKYGVLDGFVNYFTPFDVALGQRMAPATAVWDLYDKFTQESVLAAAGGPSGSIASTGVTALFNLVSNVSNGYTTTLTEDSLRVLRNFSGINSTAQAAGIMMDGVYRNRKGLALPIEVDVTDAIITGLGFTPISATEVYSRIGEYIDILDNEKAIEKMVRERSQLAWQVYPTDPDRASAILEEMQTIVSKAPLSVSKKQNLLRMGGRPSGQDFSYLVRKAYEDERTFAAKSMEAIFGKGVE